MNEALLMKDLESIKVILAAFIVQEAPGREEFWRCLPHLQGELSNVANTVLQVGCRDTARIGICWII